MLDVGAGDIQLNGRDMLQLVDTGRTLGIILGTNAGDIHNHVGADILNLRIDMLAEVIHTLVLKTYAIEHSLCRLCHTGIGISLAGLQRSAFDDDTANIFQVHEILELQTVAECSAGGHYGIAELKACYVSS